MIAQGTVLYKGEVVYIASRTELACGVSLAGTEILFVSPVIEVIFNLSGSCMLHRKNIGTHKKIIHICMAFMRVYH